MLLRRLSCLAILACAVLLALLASPVAVSATDRPIIGILTEPNPPERLKYGKSYIPLDYVQWVESGGARVVPINYLSSDEELTTAWKQLNGFLTIGGDANISLSTQYNHAMTVLYDLTVEAAQQGETVPIWGTCLGFEMLSIIASQDDGILTEFNAENITLPLRFAPTASQSTLFGTAPSSVLTTFSESPITMNWHMYGVSPDSYKASKMSSVFEILSHNEDKDGKTFISAIEGKNAPIFATQFHPERNAYDFSLPGEPVVHTKEAITAMQYLSDTFIDQARRNNHHFASALDEYNSLIYNHQPVYSPTIEPFYEMMYFFDDP